jgi:hypothetical protein
LPLLFSLRGREAGGIRGKEAFYTAYGAMTALVGAFKKYLKFGSPSNFPSPRKD